MRKTLSIIITIVLVFTLGACTRTETKTTEVTEENATLPTFALVVNSTIGDRGFVDMSKMGIEKAAEELGIEYKIFSCNNDTSIYLDTMKAAAESYDVIFVVTGYFFDAELEETKALYPDKTFIYVDGVTDIEGVYSCTFAQNEGAFLAGVLAAKLTTDTNVDMVNDAKTVGFIGGADMPVIHEYEVGFTQGVAYANPEVETIVRYAGDHFNAELGKVTANSVFEEGADVIFQAAGPTGLGVLQAAASDKFIAIGVDTDQGYLQPGFIVSSMLKRVDTAVYDITTKLANGESIESVMVYNVANGGISLADNEYYQEIVPVDIQQIIKDAINKIINGEIVVENYS